MIITDHYIIITEVILLYNNEMLKNDPLWRRVLEEGQMGKGVNIYVDE